MVTGSHSDEEWEKLMEENGWQTEEDGFTYTFPKAMRRAAKERIIKKAIEEGAVIDLDAIYEDGTLFGRGFDYTLGGHPRIFFEYAGDIYPIEIRFDFATHSIKFQITKFCAKIVDFVWVVKMVQFCIFYQKSKDLARMMFDGVATQMIRELKKRLEEYD